MEGIKQTIKKYSFEIGIISIFSIAYVIFCWFFMEEVPFLTWFDQFPLIHKYYGGILKFKDLLTIYGEHGLLGYNVLFLINVIVFKMTIFFDVLLNDINVIIIGIISVLMIRKFYDTSKTKIYKFCVILICFFSFGFIQLSSGAMETQVRLGLLFFVLLAIMVDKVIRQNVSMKYLIVTILMIFVSINIFGTLYSFAGIAIVFIIIIILFIINRKINTQHAALAISFIISALLYFLQYGLIGRGSMKSGTLTDSIKNIIVHPLASLSDILAYNASSLFGYATYADNRLSNIAYILAGVVITCIYIFAIFCYIKSKLYTKTYLPIMFIGYSVFVLFLTMIGRYNLDWSWYVQYWYTVHTKLLPIGVTWIFLYYFQTSKNKQKIITTSLLTIMLFGNIFGNFAELIRSPYEREWYLAKQPYLFAQNIDELPVDQNGQTPLLHTPQVTFDAINTMKKYGLSIYKYYSAYEEMSKIAGRNIIGNSLSSSETISGLYSDNWATKNFELKIKTGDEGKIIITGYYPNKLTGEETGTIFIDGGTVSKFKIIESNFTIEVKAPKNKIINLKIQNDFDFAATPPDERRLSFILSDIQCK